MSRELSFNRWLRGQLCRNDSTGDIAREIQQDRCWPRQLRSKSEYLDHLLYEHQAGPETRAAFERTYIEWQRAAFEQDSREEHRQNKGDGHNHNNIFLAHEVFG